MGEDYKDHGIKISCIHQLAEIHGKIDELWPAGQPSTSIAELVDAKVEVHRGEWPCRWHQISSCFLQKISRTAMIERAREFDDGEWVVTDGTDTDDPAIDGDWVVDNGDEGSIAGIFFHAVYTAAHRPAYVPFGRHPRHLPNPALSFLPPAVSIRSSSHGLLLCRGAWSSYYVCNPTTARWTPIFCPPRPHPFFSSPTLVLVSRPDSPSLFHLVCLLQLGTSGANAYHFDTFSSMIGEWRSNSVPFPTDPIIPGSASRPPAWPTSGRSCRRCSPTIHPPAPPGSSRSPPGMAATGSSGRSVGGYAAHM